MSYDEVLPTIDLNPYLNPQGPDDRENTITKVRDACCRYGFFQVKGHGIPLATQRRVIDSTQKFFDLPKEEKLEISFLKNVVRRGYEQSGDSIRDGDSLPDSKESFFVGREEPVVEDPGWHGPNVWPNPAVLPDDQFRNPVWEYYEATNRLGLTIWKILLQGLGHPSPDKVMAKISKKPVVTLKLIRTPPAQNSIHNSIQATEFGTGAHTDFGGVTCLLQQPGRDGLEIWNEDRGEWLLVPAVEDVLIINVGDLIEQWSGGVYGSVKHRVINRSNTEDRISCATFWLGDVHVTNPLKSEPDPDEETVGEQLYKRFRKQYGLWGVMDPVDFALAAKEVEVTCTIQ